MAITKLGHDKFLIRVYTGRDQMTNRRHSLNETFRGTHREAVKREQVLKVEARRRPARASTDMTLRDLIDLYIQETANRRSDSTGERLRDLVDRYIVPYLGGHRISKVDTRVIQHFLDFLSAPKKETKLDTTL
jgi:hypothetical protein